VVGERGSDVGFTLIEVLVSLVLIGIALTAFTTFFITMISATNGQSTRQAAVQLADGSMEQVRALKGSAVTAGRDQLSTEAQWAAPLAAATVARYLDAMVVAWDSNAASGSGTTATLPTVPTPVTVNGVTYSRSWYVGHCWRPPGDDDEACLSSSIPGSTEYFRVIGAVSWSDESCPSSACSYVTSTLVSSAASEPVFTGSHPVPLTVDSVGPAGGSVDATNLTGTGTRYSTSTSLSIALDKGTDNVGLANNGARLYRASAALTSAGGTVNGACGVFGQYAQISTEDPVSPVADTVTDQACYSYLYVVADLFGNWTTYASGSVKVDTTAPASAPALVFSAVSNTYVDATTVYYRPGAVSGSFTATATATDVASGIASYTFPDLGAGWTATPGAAGVVTYSWSGAGPAVPGAQTVTATNNAFRAAATAGFSVLADSVGPSGGSVDAAGLTGTGTRYATSTTVSIGLAKGTDLSGVAATGATLSRASATLSSAGTPNDHRRHRPGHTDR
jgi:prepilin-type N-terminal cleavage/methylation domain-containing protein